MECRVGCGACCIAPSIAAGSIPGMPEGKPSWVRCIHLDDNNLCQLFGKPERPKFCGDFKALPEVCGVDSNAAMQNILWLEEATQPKDER